MSITPSNKSFLSEAFTKLLRSVGIYGIDGSVFTDLESATQSPLTLYVDGTLGNDGNPGTQDRPFLTIQAAVDKVPKLIEHAITINIASGTYTGADICGFVLGRPRDPVNGCYLCLKGTLVNATLASGAQTGTVTSQVGGQGKATITVTGANWTTNDLQDKLFVVTSGTGANSVVYPIISNTATVLTVPTTNTFVDGTSTFAIMDWGTIITNSNNQSVGILSAGAPTVTGPFSNLHTFLIQSNDTVHEGTTQLYFKNLKITNTGGGRTFRIYRTNISMLGCYISSSASTAISVQHESTLEFQGTVCANSGASSTVTLAVGVAGAHADGPSNLFIGTSIFRSTSGTGMLLQSVAGIQIINTYIKAGLVGINIAGPVASTQAVTGLNGGVNIDTCTTGIQMTNLGNPMGMGFGTIDISNCTTAISVIGPHQLILNGTCTGTTNTTGISLSKGASVQVSSTSTITGTTEVSIDGTSSTLAAMRGATPKVVKDTNYFTKIYE